MNGITEQIETTNKGGDLGNTKQTKSQPVQSRYWCFTFNNYSIIDVEHLEHIFKVNEINYIMGFEIAPTTGMKHIQGFISAKKKMRPSQLKLNKKIHWEKIKGSQLENINYCAKGGDFIYHGLKVPFAIETITKLNNWQHLVMNIYFTKPNGRSIHWFKDEIGGTGKSALCKYLSVHFKVLVIQGGKLADVVNLIYKTNMDNIKMICIDIPRKNGNKVSYSAIECILNGQITNTKYETGIKYFNPPHLVVFSNFHPEEECLSADRWDIINIRDYMPMNL